MKTDGVNAIVLSYTLVLAWAIMLSSDTFGAGNSPVSSPWVNHHVIGQYALKYRIHSRAIIAAKH